MTETAPPKPPKTAWSVWRLPVPLGVLAAVGFALVLFHTRYGPEVTGDAVQYIAGARSLAQGEVYGMPVGDGSIRPIVGFPPLFSTVLAIPALLGPDPLELARWVNAAFFGVNVLLAGVICSRYSGSLVVGSLLSAWLLASSTLLQIHAAAMSEGGFIFLTLLAILSLQRYLTDGRPTWMFGAGAAIGLAVLTRYAGLSLVPAAGLAVLVLGAGSLRRRLADVAIVSGIGLIPFAYWSWHNLAVAGSATSRPFEWLLSRTRITLALDEVSLWVFPELIVRRLRILLLLGVVVLALALLGMLLRAVGRKDRSLIAFPALVLLASGSYLATLGLTMAFLDATLRITVRYLSPLPFTLAPVVFGLVHYWVPAREHTLRRGLAIATTLLIALNTVRLTGFVADPGSVFGYTDAQRLGSGTIEAIEQLDDSVTIITNEREKVYILTGRVSYSTPIGSDQFTKEKRDDLEHQMEVFHERLAGGAVLALFDTYALHDRSPTTAELIAGLVAIVDAEDGQLWVDPSAWSGAIPEGD